MKMRRRILTGKSDLADSLARTARRREHWRVGIAAAFRTSCSSATWDFTSAMLGELSGRDFALQLNAMSPEARLKNMLEMRGADSGDEDLCLVVAARDCLAAEIEGRPVRALAAELLDLAEGGLSRPCWGVGLLWRCLRR